MSGGLRAKHRSRIDPGVWTGQRREFKPDARSITMLIWEGEGIALKQPRRLVQCVSVPHKCEMEYAMLSRVDYKVITVKAVLYPGWLEAAKPAN